MKAFVPTDLDGMLKRLHLPTVRRLYAELETRAEQEEMSYRDYLAILVAEEIAHRGQTRIRRSVRKAKFPFLGTIEDFDFTFQTSVRLQLLGSFLGPELVSEGRSLILSGPTGTGKTRLAVSIAYRAIQNGFDARFTTAAHLIEELSNVARTGRLAEALHDYIHPHVLVVDEIGYLTSQGQRRRERLLELGPTAEHFLSELVHQRQRTWKGDVQRLYDLLNTMGEVDFLRALQAALLRGLIGAEYVEALGRKEASA